MHKIAIIGAMQEEVEPLLEFFDSTNKVEFANNVYYEVNYNGLDIVIAYSKIGKVFASLTASTMILKFGCTKLIFTGVAGAVNSSLKIGDLLIATKLCQHDIDITSFGHPFGYVPEGDVFINTDEQLRSLALKIAKNNNLDVVEGIIATGDQFVNTSSRKDFIKKTFNADAIEMEGASVALVCKSLNIPCLILRSISDTADIDANFDFNEFLKSSAKKSVAYVIQIIKDISNN